MYQPICSQVFFSTTFQGEKINKNSFCHYSSRDSCKINSQIKVHYVNCKTSLTVKDNTNVNTYLFDIDLQ